MVRLPCVFCGIPIIIDTAALFGSSKLVGVIIPPFQGHSAGSKSSQSATRCECISTSSPWSALQGSASPSRHKHTEFLAFPLPQAMRRQSIFQMSIGVDAYTGFMAGRAHQFYFRKGIGSGLQSCSSHSVVTCRLTRSKRVRSAVG